MEYNQEYLDNAYNATSTIDEETGTLETVHVWLKRQLLSRIKKLNELPTEENSVKEALKGWIDRHEELTKSEPYMRYANGTTRSLNDIKKDIEENNEQGQRFIKNVLSVTITQIHANKPKKPPIVRPMSELPEGNQRFSILVLHTIYDAKVWDVGFLVRENEVSDGFRIFKLKDKEFKSESGMYKIIGWLPLPNPNDIKT